MTKGERKGGSGRKGAIFEYLKGEIFSNLLSVKKKKKKKDSIFPIRKQRKKEFRAYSHEKRKKAE